MSLVVLTGLIALFGIESPGLTSSLAIGTYVAEQLERHPVRGVANPNPK